MTDLSFRWPAHLPGDPDVPTVAILGGLPIAVLDRASTADLLIRRARFHARGRPYLSSSANGEVLSRCRRDPETDRLFRSMDMLNADGQPMVWASKLFGSARLAERVATTDLFHDVAERAQKEGISFYFLGASEDENARAVDTVRKMYPDLKIAGRSHGYLDDDALDAKFDEIDALAPGVLWLSLGVPREQKVALRAAARLSRVGVIKTSGGLFNFLSGSRSRAPGWMQAAGLEWAWRLLLEPRRLFWRYAVTNPHAALLLLTRSGG